MKFISHSLRSSSSQNLPYGCAADFEIDRRGDHWSPASQARNLSHFLEVYLIIYFPFKTWESGL